MSVSQSRTILQQDVLMLDVDGVLVGLMSKRMDEAVLIQLARWLQRGAFVTFNSGRAPRALYDLVLSPLEQLLPDKRILSRVMVVGEKGGAWANYAPDGTLQIAFETALSVPLRLASAIEELVEDHELRGLMHIERGKRTMMSVVKRQEVSLDVFHQVQEQQVVPLVQHCLVAHGLAEDWKIDVVSDSTEIEHKSATKAIGSRKIMRWLQGQGVWPTRVLAIEDSPSRISMAEALHEMHVPVEFVFTGTKLFPRSDNEYPFPIIRTTRTYEQGTLEYLTGYHPPLSPLIGVGDAAWH